MFAVPGWSVPPSNLKTQTLVSSQSVDAGTAAKEGDATGRINKKRKRSSGKSRALDVNASNLADMWEKVIEGKQEVNGQRTKSEGGKETSKPQKLAKDDVELKSGMQPEQHNKKNGKKRKKKDPNQKPSETEARTQDDTSSSAPAKAGHPNAKKTNSSKAPLKISPPTPAAQLTPLQASMRQKLISARFRHLNQTLYTTPSAHSLELFQQNPEMFQEYHEGFRRQVDVWPENPVDGYIQQIRARGKIRGPLRKTGPESTDAEVLSLPRTEGLSHIADLGCGDAALAADLKADSKKFKLRIHSYDLQDPSPLVTRADIADLPLEDGSVDVAIFCLALMGTNWIDFIEEAFRILRWKGELWVAEIKSRFGRVGNARVEHSVGARKKFDKKTVSLQKRQEAEVEEKDLAIEVDGEEDFKGETDVSAFVEVLRKRGFLLHGEPDLRNKMFVKMCFIKGATPMKGKGVPVPKGMAEMGLETWRKKPNAKFIDEEAPVSSEAAVLKPCVYKLR